MRALPVIAITLGDPAGIGPEIIAATLRDPRLPRGFRFEVLGRKSGPGIKLGKFSRTSAQVALKALHEAAQGCRQGRFAAMVTGPVSKEEIARIQPDFIGQTEFLARSCDLPDEQAVMLLTDPKLTVALCSNHCSIQNALKKLSSERILYVVRTTWDFLRRRGVAHPRIALAAINPHGGENGLFGDEEKRILAPAVAQLAREKMAVLQGSADTLFHETVNRKSFDAIICAYHDQALIPFKLVAFATGVNVTLGLPLIRTSPDHGTAIALAGKNKADHRSMLAAVRLACKLTAASK